MCYNLINYEYMCAAFIHQTIEFVAELYSNVRFRHLVKLNYGRNFEIAFLTHSVSYGFSFY